MVYWFEPVLYLDPVSKFPETSERPRYFVAFADNVGDTLTFKILKKDLSTVLHRSVVGSAADANQRNKRVTFKPDEQEMIEKLDTTSNIIPRSNLPKQKTRIHNDDVASLGIRTKMLQTELDRRYKPYVIQVAKKYSFQCMMLLCLQHRRIGKT
jgi:hypothetical protein